MRWEHVRCGCQSSEQEDILSLHKEHPVRTKFSLSYSDLNFYFMQTAHSKGHRKESGAEKSQFTTRSAEYLPYMIWISGGEYCDRLYPRRQHLTALSYYTKRCSWPHVTPPGVHHCDETTLLNHISHPAFTSTPSGSWDEMWETQRRSLKEE